ncbi:hypothetical protein ASPWEDRAFT_45147 [Aspergillus wentii DTO 134E9]|uniref:Yeast cell wall synthesis Kre9/Knh1-like N-terminal domain-containing protein n=1 Tax=Aspergillus wentii DTO 134E9 TaxID=1073089 RepID=A0A1L9R8D3_ASPWE|nr:uncharacterized protein ASPWEDRAFT_45147 [Aspergillus wentii DTO 134E9]KAI9925017.1 hypothetical protein MW887_006424 [Aspergillus wentii]OJJ31186.1 hypothetical protein ASPWEDRAFT_45147 [Aspergillus wentii DTO 134E9]
MHFNKAILAAWAFLVPLGLAADYIAFTEWPSELKHNDPVTLKWVGNPDAPATITLRKGDAGNLHDVKTLTDTASGGEFTWAPEEDLPEGEDYAFEIKQEGKINFSSQLKLSKADEEIPPSKGPPPSKPSNGTAHEDDKDDDDKKDKSLDTSPNSKANGTTHGNATTTTGSRTSTPTSTHPIEKNKVSTEAQTGGASFHEYSLRWVLGAVAIIFYIGI